MANNEAEAAQAGGSRRLAGLSLAALGIVYGDIGTSPLYALRQCFLGAGRLPVNPTTVLGVLSLVFWALVVVISFKYLTIVMRADNRGEGGILALLALLDPHGRASRRPLPWLLLLAVFGAALLYGDGMITPAISVLSAMEGLQVAGPTMKDFVLPLTVGVLIALFMLQSRGSGRIGRWFGPVMVGWFVVLAVLGVRGILAEPDVLRAVDPGYAVGLFMADPWMSFLLLGGVFLVVTGGETLYADMGHFGRNPIRLAWFGLVLPGLLLNYFGQGAVILAHPALVHHPFYALLPAWGVYPMVVFATVVTVIASQAVISGAFSLTRQAIQMGQSPPLSVVQTSSEAIGQIYLPVVNWVLLIGTVTLVLGFRTSSNLAAAYGIAISATMVITTLLIVRVMRRRWRWPLAAVVAFGAVILPIDLIFLGANLFKIVSGGWVPLVIAAVITVLMTSWRRGQQLVHAQRAEVDMPIEAFLQGLTYEPPVRVRGTAVFLTAPGAHASTGLLHHLKLNQVLHERVLLLTVHTEDVPSVPASERLQVDELGQGFYRVQVAYGFMQSPNLAVAMKLLESLGTVPELEDETTTFYADRTHLQVGPGLRRWRLRLYRFMSHNALGSVDYYRLPPGRSVELGIQVEV
ncbi:potassium transporter Kup [Acidihalobacter ferrooxydans]|uniref:Probable potassium transport system protein Kup n=1 Tax=Acidihalobacter ferrooxydans TaxID=1765967 RepID=A0A1P8UF26_9GAMM|nr:KUP/HAK/KT family potassium transporter [Acidihalobacter ferrooxydans]APZ42374.1 potassium transporter Kup [Acidihalobacter ferrooxydans]